MLITSEGGSPGKASFVFIPRIHSARLLARVIHEPPRQGLDPYREEQMPQLLDRREAIG
jgi:hypothetical protein